jgi:predicted nucleic acid-binding protein
MQQVSIQRQNALAAASVSRDELPPLVLDTNVVLDLLVFRDPACQSLAGALAVNPGRWRATAPMRAEFDDVMARAGFSRWQQQCAAIAARWDALAARAEPATDAPPAMRCRDPDDQMFIDLALQLSPSVLLSRDRALLRLAAAGRRLGVRILTPTQFGAGLARA